MENITQTQAEEKRRFKRIDSSLPVQFKNLRKPAEIANGSLTRNVSEGGVCFKSSKFISLACRLVLEINLPNTPKPIKAISKVAWIRKDPSGDQYELGNQFLEITREDKSLIMGFVNSALETSL